MKKIILFGILAIILAIGAGVYWLFANLNDIVKAQVEKQGSHFLQTPVSLASVDLQPLKGYGDLKGFAIQNPDGYSDNSAFAFDEIKLDIDVKSVSQQPFVMNELLVSGPSVLFELSADGKNNLTVLKDNLSAQLPKSSQPEPEASSDKQAPSSSTEPFLVAVNKVTIEGVKLTLDMSAMGYEAYQLTLPAFNADPVGMPNGLPAEQVGGAIVKSMLDNIIKQAKKAVEDKIKQRAREEVKLRADKELGGLLEKQGN
ncbi:hypothetical protein [Shewanella aestuarii]|uniref:AsmA family protein n=1 Tax=Shewanella aestuarii TaxID=1028752 RepID=A0A6G9QPK7_9GAMM|nr:hypothetical protein [Shewanella aestuarii]QIR15995.1 hypothetical protein HBH39_17205 [Shewanella aestuarii]